MATNYLMWLEAESLSFHTTYKLFYIDTSVCLTLPSSLHQVKSRNLLIASFPVLVEAPTTPCPGLISGRPTCGIPVHLTSGLLTNTPLILTFDLSIEPNYQRDKLKMNQEKCECYISVFTSVHALMHISPGQQVKKARTGHFDLWLEHMNRVHHLTYWKTMALMCCSVWCAKSFIAKSRTFNLYHFACNTMALYDSH